MGIRIIILGGLIYLFYMLPQNFFSLPYFNIDKVNITENSKMLQPELTKISEKMYNKNGTRIDYDDLKKLIKKDIRVENVQIEQKALGEITIDVTEKALAYYAVIGKNIYLVDNKGTIFGYLNEKKIEDIPIIVTDKESEIREIAQYLNKISQAEGAKIISQIYKVNDKEYNIILADGTKLKTNKTVDIQKYSIATQLYFKMSKEKKIDYIDLRFDDYIIKYLGDEKK